MTKDEAIFYIKELQKTYASMDKKVAEAVDMAIEALNTYQNCVRCEHYYEIEDDLGVKSHCKAHDGLDLISRQAAIEVIANIEVNNHDQQNIREGAVFMLEQLPLITPQVSEDYISRQDAIEEIALHDCTNGEVPYFTGNGVQEILKLLPSVPSTEKIREWIPVSERLPEDGIAVLTTTENEEVYIDRVITDPFKERYFQNNTAFGNYQVVAWMPLPEPYKGGK